MSNNGNDPKNKKKGGKALIAAPVLALAALLLSLGDRLGIGSGSGFGLFEQKNEPAAAVAYQTPAQEQQAGPTPESVQPPAPVEPPLTIEVKEDTILYGGEALTESELKERVLELNEPDFVWKLVDNHAKKAVYDQVKSILVECAVMFTES